MTVVDRWWLLIALSHEALSRALIACLEVHDNGMTKLLLRTQIQQTCWRKRISLVECIFPSSVGLSIHFLSDRNLRDIPIIMSTTTIYAVGHIPSTYLSLPVRFVRVVSHTMGPVVPGAQLSQNHWSIYLITQGGSIRINMTLQDPKSNDDTGAVQVSFHPYELSTSATAYWDFQPVQNITVEHFTNNIITNRRQNYRMAENGVGCRYWMYVSYAYLLT